jgi:hypothetical protein
MNTNNNTPKTANLPSKAHSDDTQEDGSFTMVSYRRSSNTSTRAAHARNKKDKTLAANSLPGTLTMALLTQFKTFQQDIFPIIETITNDPTYKNHPTIKEWLAAKMAHRISSNSTFRFVSKSLGFQDLNNYRTFIEKLPNIKSYLTFHTGIGKTSFKYEIHHTRDLVNNQNPATNIEDTPPAATSESKETTNDNDSIATKNTNVDDHTDTTWHTCYGTQTDLSDMLSVFWPVIQDYIHQNPNHDHAQQWQQWITVDGLNVNTELQQLKRILQVNTMDQLFIILRDSPAINTKFDLHWNHKICYRLKHDSLDKNLLPETKHDTPGHTHVTTMNDDEFSILHKIIYELISEWTLLDIAKSHEHWLQWKKWGLHG